MMRLILGDCDRCGRQAECVELLIPQLKAADKDYESSNLCGSCIGKLFVLAEGVE